ncbi:MAG: TIM barrel protein [Acidimicrobiia bacterium]|nr:TIM barrel protein [Acidimicrobiia bacterium]MDX2466323.1 TIM barrel protein [Acidimicrobiia bacterium]
MTSMMSRIAGAPITWGVDGSPGWGHLMDADRVLDEMAEVGLRATELGPDGYLPVDPAELKQKLDHYQLELVGGFVPAVLHHPARAEGELAYVQRASRTLAGCGANVLVLGPSSGLDGYDTSIEMSEPEWSAFLENLKYVIGIAADEGLTVALHQHWGMAIEQSHHMDRLIAQSEVEFCLDTGHLSLGGVDPVAIAQAAEGRVAHVHLKDVDREMAEQVRSGVLPFRQAVIDGIFKPLGYGDVDIAGFVRTLEDAGFDGWYVLEQDKVLEADPLPGKGPIEDAKRNFEYLGSIV